MSEAFAPAAERNGEQEYMAKRKRQWDIKASQEAKKTYNPIRNTVERITVQPNSAYKLIRMTLGDPAVYGNFPPSPKVVEAVLGQLEEGKQLHGKGPPNGEGLIHTGVCTQAEYTVGGTSP